MSLPLDDKDYEWEPPTEPEMKVIQARRDRQDKISKLMGDYLLKGYRMLGECCDVCGVSEVDSCDSGSFGDVVKMESSYRECFKIKFAFGFQTILLQDKQQKYYCVSCQELDSDVDKDNPGMYTHTHTHSDLMHPLSPFRHDCASCFTPFF